MPGLVNLETRVCIKQNLTAFPHTCYKYRSENLEKILKNLKILCLQKPYVSDKAILTDKLFHSAETHLFFFKVKCLIFLSLIEYD